VCKSGDTRGAQASNTCCASLGPPACLGGKSCVLRLFMPCHAAISVLSHNTALASQLPYALAACSGLHHVVRSHRRHYCRTALRMGPEHACMLCARAASCSCSHARRRTLLTTMRCSSSYTTSRGMASGMACQQRHSRAEQRAPRTDLQGYRHADKQDDVVQDGGSGRAQHLLVRCYATAALPHDDAAMDSTAHSTTQQHSAPCRAPGAAGTHQYGRHPAPPARAW
jgi:hypothetical protein